MDEIQINGEGKKRLPRYLSPKFQEDVKKKKKARLEKQHDQMILARQAGAIKRKINEFDSTREISDKQRVAINLLLDWENQWPMEFIADQAGVSVPTLHRWKNTPRFLEELDREITKRRTYVRRDAFTKFFRAVKRGEPWAIKEYLKMTGDLNPNNKIEDNSRDDKTADANIDNEIRRLSDELGLDISIEDVPRDSTSEEDEA